MIYELYIIPPIGEGQPYVETIEALTAHDAESRVQRRNPGCQVRCQKSYEAPRSSSASADVGDAMGWIILTGIVLGIWAVIQYWYIVVPVAALILAAVLWNKFVN